MDVPRPLKLGFDELMSAYCSSPQRQSKLFEQTFLNIFSASKAESTPCQLIQMLFQDIWYILGWLKQFIDMCLKEILSSVNPQNN